MGIWGNVVKVDALNLISESDNSGKEGKSLPWESKIACNTRCIYRIYLRIYRKKKNNLITNHFNNHACSRHVVEFENDFWKYVSFALLSRKTFFVILRLIPPPPPQNWFLLSTFFSPFLNIFRSAFLNKESINKCMQAGSRTDRSSQVYRTPSWLYRRKKTKGYTLENIVYSFIWDTEGIRSFLKKDTEGIRRISRYTLRYIPAHKWNQHRASQFQFFLQTLLKLHSVLDNLS